MTDSLWLMDFSMPSFPVLHYLPEFAQTHVHSVNDVIQSSHPLSPPSLPAFSPSQHQDLVQNWLFTSGGQIIKASVSVLPMNIQSWFPLELTGSISLLSKGLSRVFSNTTIGKHQSFGTQPYLWSNSHIRIQLLEKPQLWLYGPLLIKWSLCFLIHCLGLSY